MLLHEIIWYNRKIELNIWYRNLCLQLQRSEVSCSSWPGLHTLQQGFWPTPPFRSSPDLSGFWGCRWATQSFNFLHRFSIVFRSGDWLGHSRTLKCFSRSHSLVALAVCLGSLPRWKTQPRPSAQCSYWGKEAVGQNLAIHGPIHHPLNTVQSSCPLCRKAPLKHYVSTPMLHSWDGVLWIVLILLLHPNTSSGVYTKKLYFGLIWPHDLLPCLLWIIQMVFGKLQTGLNMCWLEQRDLARAAGF